jgi:hypothetical protein
MGFGGFGRAPLESGEFLLQIGIHRIAPGMLKPAPSTACGLLDCRAVRAAGFVRLYSSLSI